MNHAALQHASVIRSARHARPHFAATPAALAVAVMLALAAPAALAQAAAAPANASADEQGKTLSTVTVNASADASAQGLSPAYPGGQVARGARAGILGTKDAMDTPFSITSYTNELIQDRHARSVGDVLQNDPTVRVARGFGNFQESFFIRGFILDSDDTAYNGLYSLLPRQYIATELFERVEVLRGASAFLNGASPNGGGLGGSINLLPKRAPNEPLNRVTFGLASGGQTQVAADIARRFGPDGNTGIRVNAAARNGGTAVDDEHSQLGLLAVGLDWRSRDVRVSGDIGWQDHKLRNTRTNVTLGSTVTSVPTAPDNQANFAQPWSYSNERDLFGTLRGEWDLSPTTTAWAAAGARRGEEANSLANLTVSNASTGAAATDGQRVIGVPKLQANLGAEWDVPGVPGLAVDGRWVHTGASYANATNTLRVPGWNRLDVGARYLTEVQGRLVTLRARIDNLTNRNHWASVGGYPGSGYLVVGAPRTLSLSVGVDF